MRRVAPCVLALAALAVAGCGLGAGERKEGASLVVTDAFGAATLVDLVDPRVEGSDTIMRVLQRNASVKTRYGGGFVSQIDGRRSGTRGGRPTDWFFYINGLLSEDGAASRRLRANDAVWWDRHDWGGGETKAVVGSFPEPFRHGPEGKRLPVRVECVDSRAPACDRVQDALTKVGVLAAKGGIQTSFTKETLRVLVGSYEQLRGDRAVRTLEEGPRASGIYARPSRDGRSIAVLDERGRVRRTLTAGAGLVGATVYEDGQPIWIVTGTDDAGVLSAAGAMDEGTLKNRFALAVADDRGVRVPEVGPPR
jgi:hypothetical protein